MIRFIQLDEEGYFAFDGLRVSEGEYGAHLLTHLRQENRQLLTDAGSTPSSGSDRVIVEAFDHPLIVRHVRRGSGRNWVLQLPYGVEAPLDLQHIFADEWDRFLGYTEVSLTSSQSEKSVLPFVMSRSAQSDFFQLVDEFDDDGFRVDGVYYPIRSWWASSPEVRDNEFWSRHYREWKDEESKPGWEMGSPALPLGDILPQIKLMRSKIAVLGAGSAHDAAYFAKQGHLVTAIDVSEEAIDRARANYGNVAGLDFLCADAFNLSPELTGQFDVVFEHTFFCAIDPVLRQQLVDIYSRLLREGGYLLGIFFVMDKGDKPPFGATEWELRERLRKKYNFLYWTRWKKSIPGRLGKELVLYAQKIDLK